jgi:hypothetical protein
MTFWNETQHTTTKAKAQGLIAFAVVLLCLPACQESLEQRAMREAKQYTAKNCPMRVDDYTVMDSMTFMPAAEANGTPTLCYWYTVDGEADRDYTPDECNRVTEALKKEVANSTHLANYREAGYTFRYIYHSASTPEKTLFDTSVK